MIPRMHTRFAQLLLLIWMALGCTCAVHAAPGDWQPLLDGKTLAGWEGDPRYWSVRDGVLTGESSATQPLAQTTWLVWRGGTVRDFEFSTEYRLQGGNSGVQFRSEARANYQVAGLQADLEDGPNWSGCIYEQEGRGVLVRRGQSLRALADGKTEVQSIGDFAQLLKHQRDREWNRYSILARGRTIEVRINDQLMSVLEDHDPRYFREAGVLALQLHAGPPMKVEFRDMRLRVLEPAPLKAAAVDSTPIAEAQWIWGKAQDSAELLRTFELKSPARVRLWVSADNHAEVLLDGRTLLTTHDWQAPGSFESGRELPAGKHELVIRARNDGGPCGVLLEARFEHADKSKTSVVSDALWQVNVQGQREAAVVLGPHGIEPWGKLDGFGARAPEATPASELHIKSGYHIDRLYSVPRGSQGSWVSLAYDGVDTLYACDQYGDIHRVRLSASHEEVVSVEPVPAPVGGAHGLLWTNGALYAVVAESPRCATGLWRVTDKDGDGALEHAELLKSFAGSGEHGPHSVIQGPDGMLYILAGNHTLLPEGIRTYYVPKTWAEDQLVKHRNDPGGHAVGVMAPGGWVCRTDLDGKHWDLFAAGMRNSYDLAFVGKHDLFTFDSDMEWDIGLPWYRPTRVLNLVSGADFGWRNGNGKWKDYYPDSLPAVKDLGLGSPTGVVAPPRGFAPAGSAEGAPDLLVGDWAYGRIFALWLQPDASTFSAQRTEIFASGRPMPVADMALGRANEVFVVTGGRRVQSGLYRMWCAPAATTAKEEERFPPNVERLSRMEVEAFHARADDAALDILWPKLGASDRFKRHAARVALEAQPREKWVERAFQETHMRAIVQCMLALIHLDARDLQDRILNRLGETLQASRDDFSAMEILRAIQVALARWGMPPQGNDFVFPTVDSLFYRPVDRAPLSNPLLAEIAVVSRLALSKLRTVDLLELSTTQEAQLNYMSLLAEFPQDMSTEERTRYLQWWRTNAAHWRGGNSFGKYLEQIHSEIVGAIPEPDRVLFQELLTPLPRPTPVPIPAAGQSKPWTVTEIEPSLDELKRGRNFALGKELYTRTSCIQCHRLAGEGGSTGPDLTGAGARFSARDLLVAILEPSQTISDQYRETEVITSDEELFVGRAAGGDDKLLRLVDRDGKTIEIERNRIAKEQPARLSAMPTALTDGLTRTELLDLLAYVLAGGSAADAAFQPAPR